MIQYFVSKGIWNIIKWPAVISPQDNPLSLILSHESIQGMCTLRVAKWEANWYLLSLMQSERILFTFLHCKVQKVVFLPLSRCYCITSRYDDVTHMYPLLQNSMTISIRDLTVSAYRSAIFWVHNTSGTQWISIDKAQTYISNSVAN